MLSLKLLIQTLLFVCFVKPVFLKLNEHIVYNYVLEGFILNQLPGISFANCWKQCEQRSLCKSINYLRRLNLCVLNLESEETVSGKRLTQTLGCVYKFKESGPNNFWEAKTKVEWLTTRLHQLQKCGGSVCSEGEVCNESNQCTVRECSIVPFTTSNNQILGNVFSIGTRVIVSCRDGYRSITENKLSSSECLANGTWSSKLICIKGLNCKEFNDNGVTASGVRVIYPDDVTPVKALCVMDVDGGGWTVIQKRETASDFYRGWQQYRDGFGDETNFWLGLENIHCLTAQGNFELRVEMRRTNKAFAAAKYSNFSVGNESTGYILSVGGYSFDPAFVNPGDSLTFLHNRMKFSTYDRDNDISATENCAIVYKGGWWYGSCHQSNPNGLYGTSSYAVGMVWYTWTGHYESLIYTRIMIRPH